LLRPDRPGGRRLPAARPQPDDPLPELRGDIVIDHRDLISRRLPRLLLAGDGPRCSARGEGRTAIACRGVSLESVEVVVRGYRAFIDGDFAAIADLLDPDVEWYPLDPELLSFADQQDVLAVVAERYREQYRVELERCVGEGDRVVVSFRASREMRDP